MDKKGLGTVRSTISSPRVKACSICVSVTMMMRQAALTFLRLGSTRA
jgi:hypothetical protein